jgi:hypothetical protein
MRSFLPNMTSRLAAVALAVVGLLALSACSPAPQPHLGLHRLHDGTVQMVVYLCPYDGLIGVDIFTDDDGTLVKWRIASDVSPAPEDGHAKVVKLTAFASRDGWTTEEATLTGLAADRRYSAGATVDGPVVTLGAFTLSDLGKTDDTTVIAGGSSKKPPTVMSIASFEKHAADDCGKTRG